MRSGRRAPVQVLRPDGASHLTDGVVVETTLTAKLLGLRLQRVDGVVLMSPGRLETPALPHPRTPPDPPATEPEVTGGTLARVGELLHANGEQLRRLR